MATYATTADFILAFGEAETQMLSELDEPNSISVDGLVIQRALEDASAEVDSYLSAARIVFNGDPPLILRNKVCDIARYRLDRNRQREDVRKRYEDAVKFFLDVVRGNASLGNTPGTDQPAVQRSSRAIGYTGEKVFTRDSLRFY